MCGDGFGAVVHRHAFGSGSYAHIYAAYRNSVCDGGDGLKGGSAGTVDRVERGGGGVADVVESHAGCFGAAQLGEDGADCDILDSRGGKGGVGC